MNQNAVKKGKRKILPLVFYKEIDAGVRNKLKAPGFLAFDIGTVFGNRIKKIVDVVGAVQRTLKSKREEVDSKTIDSLVATLMESGQEENLGNLKRKFFEFLLYPVLKTCYGNATIKHSVVYRAKKEDGKTYYEYDFVILSEQPKEIIVVEAKGYASTSTIELGTPDTRNTLQWFYGRTFPFIKTFFAKELSEGYKLKACYITSARISDEGKKFLKTRAQLKPKNLYGYYEGSSLKAYLHEQGVDQVYKTLKRYFVPDERTERKVGVMREVGTDDVDESNLPFRFLQLPVYILVIPINQRLKN